MRNLCGLIFITTVVLWGQDQPVLRSITRAVVVDVTVSDKQGRPVGNLSKTDFTVLENGVPQKIASFEAIRPKAEDLPASQTVILLDELNSQFTDMAYANLSINKLLRRHTNQLEQRTEVLALSDLGLQVLQPYTQDRSQLAAAIKQHVPAQSFRQKQGLAGATERIALTMHTLVEIATTVRGSGLRTNLIWIGSGFPAVQVSTLRPEEREGILDELRSVSTELLRSRIVITSLDPMSAGWSRSIRDSGLRSPVGPVGFNGLTDDTAVMGDFALEKLANQTGGRAIYGRNDVDVQVGNAIAAGGSGYAISYYPSNTNYDGRFRKIEVKAVGQPGLEARTRDGYYGLAEGVDKVGVRPEERDVVFALASKMNYGAIPVRAARERDELVIRVDPSVIAWSKSASGAQECDLVVGFVGTAKGGGGDMHFKRFRGETNKPGHVASGGRQDLEVTFKLPLDVAQAAQIRVAVRDTDSGRIGTAGVRLN